MSITRIDNVFSVELMDRIHDHVMDAKFVYGWRSNVTLPVPGHWNAQLIDPASMGYRDLAGPSNGLDVSDYLGKVMGEAWIQLQDRFPDMILLRCYANQHTYGVEGYPHTDSARDSDVTLVVYVNKTWNLNWGGETQLFSGGEISYSLLPKYNRGVVFPGNMLHVARGVTRLCPAPRTTLMFKMAHKNADLLRDDLQRFLLTTTAYDKPHTGRMLADHLLGTYDLLRARKAPDHVCLAGGAHSLLGTNAFKEITLDAEGAKRLEALIGEKAFKMVRTFSSAPRPQYIEAILANTPSPPDDIRDLAALEAANLLDQGELARWPNIARFWQGYQN